jgi:hypothetical protein
MANKRATVRVSVLKAKFNDYLRQGISESERKALCVAIENVLHETGNYQGFNYVDWLEGGADRWRADGEPKDNSKYLGPEYKRFYF